MIIKGRDYVLSERTAEDVLALGEICDKLDLPKDENVTLEQTKNAIMVGAQALNDSFKATYFGLPFYLKIFGLRYRKFVKGDIGFITRNVSGSVLIQAQNKLTDIDGKKKEGKKAGKKLEEKFAKA